jgi:diguanylate cyclase
MPRDPTSARGAFFCALVSILRLCRSRGSSWGKRWPYFWLDRHKPPQKLKGDGPKQPILAVLGSLPSVQPKKLGLASMDQLQDFLSVEVLAWVVPCALVCVALGAILGREIALRKMSRRLRTERQFLTKTLRAAMDSTEQLHTDMDVHNSDLHSVQAVVSETASPGELEPIQEILIEKIAEVVAANKKLEDDLVVTRYQLEEQAQMLDSTRKEARLDQLSGLGNRKSFDEAIKFAVSSYKSKDVPFALILADVDHFKRINDTYGHQAGDKVVARIGETLKQLVRQQDHIARYGGDEFAIVLMKVKPEDAQAAAARIRSTIEQTNFSVGANAGHISATFSMGMSLPAKGDTVEKIIARADRALYESKKRGRNQLQIITEATAEEDQLPHDVGQLAHPANDVTAPA